MYNSILFSFVKFYSFLQVCIVTSSLYQVCRELWNAFEPPFSSHVELIKNGQVLHSIPSSQVTIKVDPKYIHSFQSNVPMIVDVHQSSSSSSSWFGLCSFFSCFVSSSSSVVSTLTANDFDFAIVSFETKAMKHKNEAKICIVCHSHDMKHFKEVLETSLSPETHIFFSSFVKDPKKNFLSILLTIRWLDTDETTSVNVNLIEQNKNFCIVNNELNLAFWKYYVHSFVAPCHVCFCPREFEITSLEYMDAKTFQFKISNDKSISIH